MHLKIFQHNHTLISHSPLALSWVCQCLCARVVPFPPSQVSALVVGLASLIAVDKNVRQQVNNVTRRGGGGVSRLGIFRVGEMEFEALMRMLDNQASVCVCVCHVGGVARSQLLSTRPL